MARAASTSSSTSVWACSSALALGWGGRETLVIAGIVGISSSAIVTKLLVELRRLANPETGMLLGIIVVEDVFLALYLALLQPVIGDSPGGLDAVLTVGRALVFLILMFAVARWGRRAVGRLLSTGDDELLTVSLRRLRHPGGRRRRQPGGVRGHRGLPGRPGGGGDGRSPGGWSTWCCRSATSWRPSSSSPSASSVDPGTLADVALPVAAAVGVTIVGNLVAGIVAARLQGFGPLEAANIGLSVLARGEFSLILASLAVVAGLDDRLGPFAAAYVLVLAVAGPLAASRSHVLARVLPRRLFPRKVASEEGSPSHLVPPAPTGGAIP